MIYTCEACKTTFEGTAEEAFDIGWDTPERFLSHCTCPNCTIDKTVWWKAVILKEPLTIDEVALLQKYNQMASPEARSMAETLPVTIIDDPN